MTRLHHIFLIITVLTSTLSCSGKVEDPPFKKYLQDEWVNNTIESLTLEQKIAQLLTIAAYPSQKNQNRLFNQIEKYNPGGVIVMQGSPYKTAQLINKIQLKSNVPTLISIDAEWGAAMRVDSVMRFPYAQIIGAVQDTNLLNQFGTDMAQQLKMMGIHVNYAPVVDINTNPNNPVINFRSLGDQPMEVAKRAGYITDGMTSERVLPIIKHFPGHGDTSKDSHKTLPIINDTKAKLDNFTTIPFQYLINKGISGIMVGHLNTPVLDSSGIAASLSSKVIEKYLIKELEFKGLIVTDAINMAGAITKNNKSELKALLAGNDRVEFVTDIDNAIKTIKQAVKTGIISEAQIDQKLRKTLAVKKWVNLQFYEPTDLYGLTENLNKPSFELTKRKLIQGALTTLNNNDVIPIKNLEDLKIASVMIGSNNKTAFQSMLSKYTKIDHYILPKNSTKKKLIAIRKALDKYNLVIVGIDNINRYPTHNFGVTELQKTAVYDIVSSNKSIVVLFGNAYALQMFEDIHHSAGLIAAYENDQLTQELAAQLIFGAFSSGGKLPVSVDHRFKSGDGLSTKNLKVLSYSIPESVGLDSKLLNYKIDSIAQMGVDSAAYPGCQVLVAKDGAVIFHKCYGYHTYEKVQKVTRDNIYDWASITKVTGPLPAIMQLVDQKKINLNARFSRYWSDFQHSNKRKIKFKEVLAHQARLTSWIPFWKMTMDEDKNLDKTYFQDSYSNQFNIKVTDNLFLNRDFIKTIYDTIRTSDLLKRKKYVYSGLSFYIYPQIITNLTAEPYEQYLQNHFYKPLGATTVGFNPYKRFNIENIIPTENDTIFRHTNLRGYVHDEGAAMLGGISGNAGLFGTTNDLAKIFQMYLQMGYYGDKRYINETTMKNFTSVQYPKNKNRRGLGFDKPYIDNYKKDLDDAYPAYSTSSKSFGHSGYTGTFAWADPESKILYIFMSNRVHPTRNNLKLYRLNIRTAIHQAIYDSIIK